MNIHFVRNSSDYVQLYSNEEKGIKEYPSDYPCILIINEVNDSTVGNHGAHRIINFPKNLETDKEHQDYYNGILLGAKIARGY
jgi:hypothetical protein